MFIVPGLVILGDFMVFLGMWMVYRVVKENSITLVYLVGMSLALGSYWTLMPIVLTILALVWRLFDEEAFLEKNLSGYTEYCAKVRWHLIPLIF